MQRALLFLALLLHACTSDESTNAPSNVDAASDTSSSDAAASDGGSDGFESSDSFAPPVIVDIAASGVHSCAVSADGRLRCWGDNREGELGDGTTMPRTAPVDVPGITGATAVSATGYHTCAVVGGGAVRCWGNNYAGVLGDGTTTRSLVPRDVPEVTGAKAIVTGEGHTCAILGDGTMRCWGSNQYGQLGDATAVGSAPVTAIGLTGVIAVGTGNGFTCVALDDGTASCFGAGSEGELGDGTTPFSRKTPGPVPGLTTVKDLTAGQGHACALLGDGTVQCWGSNSGGALGDGKTHVQSSTPVTVLGVSNAKAIRAVGQRTCALLGDGTVTCWGPTQTPVAALTGATKIAAGGCAIVGAGNGVKCWGSNAYGQLGDGTTTSSDAAVSVLGLP